MAKFEIDYETYLLMPVFMIGTMASLGIISSDILPVVNLSDVLLDISGIELTYGRALSIGALFGVVINRDEPLDLDAWGVIETWVFYVTLGLVVAPPFFPAFEDTILHGAGAFLAFTIQSIGFTLVTYIN